MTAMVMSLRPGIPAARWSRYIYMALTGMTSNQCATLCLMAANVTCHYYVVVGSTCYLGNLNQLQSILSQRTDSQDLYFLAGFIEVFFMQLSLALKVEWWRPEQVWQDWRLG